MRKVHNGIGDCEAKWDTVHVRQSWIQCIRDRVGFSACESEWDSVHVRYSGDAPLIGAAACN